LKPWWETLLEEGIAEHSRRKISCGEEVGIVLCSAEYEAHGGLRWLWFFIILFLAMNMVVVMMVIMVVMAFASLGCGDGCGGL
jgi:dolichol kinase